MALIDKPHVKRLVIINKIVGKKLHMQRQQPQKSICAHSEVAEIKQLRKLLCFIILSAEWWYQIGSVLEIKLPKNYKLHLLTATRDCTRPTANTRKLWIRHTKSIFNIYFSWR